MHRIAESWSASRFPLIEDRAKGIKLLGVMILGRGLRDIILPASSQVGRGVYVSVLVGVMLYLVARPGISAARAVLWAVLGGLATMAIVAL